MKRNTELITQKGIINYILKGGIVLLPVVLVIVIISFLFNFIVGIVRPISIFITSNNEPHWSIHFISLIILFATLYLVGVLISSKYGSLYFAKFEKMYMKRIPFYSVIRDTVQQFAGIKDMPFKQVVLIDIFDTGTMLTGFVTQVIGEEALSVYVPTAPNPMNGNIYHVPKDKVTFIDVKPEVAMRSIIGLGTGSQELFARKSDKPRIVLKK